MVTEQTCRELALSFPESHEEPHFEKPSFRIGKKIFATMNLKENRVCAKLSDIDQDVFSAFDKNIIYPVPNKWGKQGWTLVDLGAVREDMLLDILSTAYCEVAPSRLAAQIRGSVDGA
ncbi:MAG: MmcQ/YjbR family DNA-binding protein [Daejeonella sp.]|uniref:MmcQ/YjbR family DNA-binding protein n=1 Tax=Daejeonella sp. JGW-45 TaxID=3034148 RepID=UPI0023ECA4FE|nr:MmcQ/YjbR family DNA-binding protein [Daejeonella sp. JGW-45]